MRERGAHSYTPVALWPDARRDLSHLTGAAERALSERRGVITGMQSADGPVAPGTLHVAFPVEIDDEIPGAVVLELRTRGQAELQEVLRQLLWGAGWLEALLRKRQLAGRAAVLERASIALDLVQVVQEHETLGEAALALVNELATSMKVDRASLGLERAGVMRLRAISRTAWFDPKSQLVDVIERAMEEAVDQSAVVSHPPSPQSREVTIAQRELSVHAGAQAVLTLPVMAAGRPVGALTLERDAGPPFDPATVTILEAICAVVGPALRMHEQGERWFAGRAARTLADWRVRVMGPRDHGLKAVALLVLVACVILTFVQAPFRVSARTVIEGSIQRAAVAPFDGYIREARVRAGAVVKQGDLLASMEDRELRLDRAKWDAEREQVSRKYAEALAKRERAAAGIVQAQIAQAESQLALADEKLSRTRIVAPFDGVVVSGDLSQLLGAPIEKGKVLFELAPLDQYRVVLRIDERDIGFVQAGQQGELALAGVGGDTLAFVVKTVTSVSTAQDGRNFYRVEAQLTDASPRLRPGMEGVGKVMIESRRLAWIWTRHFLNWVRLSAWNWMP